MVKLGLLCISVGRPCLVYSLARSVVPSATIAYGSDVMQDDVPSFPDAEAFRIIEANLGRPMEEVFSAISEHPIAAASLGQVRVPAPDTLCTVPCLCTAWLDMVCKRSASKVRDTEKRITSIPAD